MELEKKSKKKELEKTRELEPLPTTWHLLSK